MAERTSTGGSAPWIAFIAGALIIGAIAFSVFAFMGSMQQQPTTPNIEITTPRIETPDITLPNVQPPQAPLAQPAVDAPVVP